MESTSFRPATTCRTVGELLDALSEYPRDTKLEGTWEGTTQAVHVYQALDGTVLLDCDGCDYMVTFQHKTCHYCAHQPIGYSKDETPVPICYQCCHRLKIDVH